jgi:hypothetical protein
MKSKNLSIVLTGVLLATVLAGTIIALAEPPFPEAVYNPTIDIEQYRMELQSKVTVQPKMELAYVTHGSGTVRFATEAELCSFLGVDWRTAVVELKYIAVDGQRFASEPELAAHMEGL